MSESRKEYEEPRRRAVALRYEHGGDAAPRVVAGGEGEIADRILAIAKEHGVPLVEDRSLVELLAACDVGREIPEDLFEVVAALIAFLWDLDGELGRKAA
ncbi:MAG: EscU/YscU/HrcU family type III secretion system export apparatus switch protein [Planctomycetota bacterium]